MNILFHCLQSSRRIFSCGLEVLHQKKLSKLLDTGKLKLVGRECYLVQSEE